MKGSGPTGGPTAWPPARSEVSASRLAKRLARAAAVAGVGSRGRQRRSSPGENLSRPVPVRRAYLGLYQQRPTPLRPGNAGRNTTKSPAMLIAPSAWRGCSSPQRVRTRLAGQDEGMYVVNTARSPWSGWVTVPVDSLGGHYKSVEDARSGIRSPIEFRSGWALPPGREGTRPREPCGHVPRKGRQPAGQLLGRAARRRRRAAAAPAKRRRARKAVRPGARPWPRIRTAGPRAPRGRK